MDLYEAAEIDGAGPIQRMFNITIPFMSPHLFFTLVMGFIGPRRTSRRRLL